MYDLVVTGGTVVTPGGVQKLDVAIQGERIAALGSPGTLVESAARTIDADRRIVIPGGVDPHLHFSVPFGGAEDESQKIRSESQDHSHAAAAGGTTAIVDFVFHESKAAAYLSPFEAIQTKRDEADGRMAVDYGLHFAFTQNPTFEEIEQTGDIIRRGLPTIKTLTTYGWITADGHIYGIMSEVARHGGMSIAHAEDDAIANWLTAKYIREGKTRGAYISEVRPALVEEAAIRRLMVLAEATGSSLYMLHVGAASGVRALVEAHARGQRFYVETLAAYLSFTQDMLFEEGGLLKSNFPTIKTQRDQDELWLGLADGRVATVGSDHSGNTRADRYEIMGSELPQVQGGQAASEMRLPVVYSMGVAEGRISLERFVEVVSSSPAKLMGLWPRKGQIAIGSDADLAIIDPNGSWTVSAETHHMSSDYNAYEGWELKGRVMTTILRGAILYEEGSYVGSKTSGKFIARRLLPEYASTGPARG